MEMLRVNLLQILLLKTAVFIIIADVPRPRGVSLELASLYYPENGDKWTCLDGSKQIKFAEINDDFCDCKDSSDEPGTAACLRGTFYCENVGHRPQNIPSSRVNDNVCDCCDGSDEIVRKCTNTCLELGQAEQEKFKSRVELHKRGSAKRSEMVTKGKQLRAERELRLQELERRRQEVTVLKEEKLNLQQLAEAAESEALEVYRVLQNEQEGAEAAERAKAEEEPQTQRMEAEAQFLRYDSNGDGLIEVAELQVDMALDRDRNNVVTVEEARYFLDERDRIDIDAFVALSWPRIKPLKMLAEGIFQPPKSLTNDEVVKDDDQEEMPLEGSEGLKVANDQENDNLEDLESEEEYEDEADVGVGSALPEDKPTVEYDPETQHLIDLANEARRATSDVENELREIENEIKEIDDYTNKDYGLNDEYASMNGECYTFEDREYTYTLCPFERASQKQRSGGSETTLGRWDQWVAENGNKYAKQKYSHGSSCWNGPQRSALVSMNCGLETKITAVSEPNRCEYFYELETPAACDDAPFAIEQESSHDEL